MKIQKHNNVIFLVSKHKFRTLNTKNNNSAWPLNACESIIWEIPLKIPAESDNFGEGFSFVNLKMRKTRCYNKTIIYRKTKLKVVS